VPWARARLRVLLARASLAHDYGAGGAALFDIVNVQNWTRRRTPARSSKVASAPEAASRPFVNFAGWFSSSGRALAL
jgi:hypothetical protein